MTPDDFSVNIFDGVKIKAGHLLRFEE